MCRGLPLCGVRTDRSDGMVFVPLMSLLTTVLAASTVTAPSASRSRSAIESVQELRSPEQLRSGIANFYDRSSRLWERTWGEHMHHGYYGPTGRERKDHQCGGPA